MELGKVGEARFGGQGGSGGGQPGHRRGERPEDAPAVSKPVENVSRRGLLGGLGAVGGLVLAAVDTAGQPGVAYRAQSAGRTARREAKHLARATRLQAKLAAKSVAS